MFISADLLKEGRVADYREVVAQLRKAFPPPVSDPVHDGYVVFSLLRALDRVDGMKSEAPVLGVSATPDYEAAATAAIAEHGQTLEDVIPQLATYLNGMPIWGHPRSQVNVSANASIASIIGNVLPAIFNPNLCSDESGHGFSEVEVRVVAAIARLLGYDPGKAGGVFTFGGTGTLLYGMKIALEKALPGSMGKGLRENALIFASDHSHYACLNVAGWLGIGHENVVAVATHDDNSMDVAALEKALRSAAEAGSTIAAVVATMGTTDAFGVDDLAAIDALLDKLTTEGTLPRRPHLHADAVIGWAWSVFSDYDFDGNPLGFRGRTLRALAAVDNRMQHLHRADSLGIDFHKTGFTPYTSSLFMLADRSDFGQLLRQRETMPYLYHTGDYHPGMYTLETTRGATGPMSAWANLLMLGKEGFRALLGNAVEMACILREALAARPGLTVLNHQNSGPVTLFRAYPAGVDTFTIQQREATGAVSDEEVLQHNALNERIFHLVHQRAMAGEGVAIGLTSNYRTTATGLPIVALKSYVLSPFADEHRMHSVVEHVTAAQAEAAEN